jgi:hypothetical protein
MARRAKVFMTVMVILTIAFSTTVPSEARQGCRYWVLVSRQGFPGEQSAAVCDIGALVDWLRLVPEAEISAQAPQVALNDGFTVTIFLQSRGFPGFPIETLPNSPGGEVLLTERVYPVAEGGPVAFVPSRSIFHGVGRYSRWTVRAGWRSLDASTQVPSPLAKLGLLQIAVPTPTFTRAAPSATSSSRPGPDLVTLLFIVAILVPVGVAVRRSMGRTRPQIGNGLDSHAEPPHHG